MAGQPSTRRTIPYISMSQVDEFIYYLNDHLPCSEEGSPFSAVGPGSTKWYRGKVVKGISFWLFELGVNYREVPLPLLEEATLGEARNLPATVYGCVEAHIEELKAAIPPTKLYEMLLLVLNGWGSKDRRRTEEGRLAERNFPEWLRLVEEHPGTPVEWLLYLTRESGEE